MHRSTATPAFPGPPWAVGILLVGLVALTIAALLNRPPSSAAPAAITRVVASERPPGPPRIVVTLTPLLWVARQLAPADAHVALLVPPGQGCSALELTPSQITDIRQADMLLLVGAGLEPQVDELAATPWQRRVTLAGALPQGESLIAASCDHDHVHDHDHHAQDPHLWLDPLTMRGFVDQCAGQMIALWPHEEAHIQAAADRAQSQIREIDAQYRARLADLTSRTIVTHHNAWGYMARRYGLEVAAVIQPSHDVEPTPGDVAAAASAVRQHHVGAIFIEPQLSSASAQRVAAATGVRVLTLDALGNGDWPAMMRANLDALVEGLGAK